MSSPHKLEGDPLCVMKSSLSCPDIASTVSEIETISSIQRHENFRANCLVEIGYDQT